MIVYDSHATTGSVNAGESRVAWQEYSPACDVCIASNVRTWVVIVFSIDGIPTVMSSPVSTVSPLGPIHVVCDTVVMPLTTSITTQLSEYLLPAVGIAVIVGLTCTLIGEGGTANGKEPLVPSAMKLSQ